MVGRFRPHELRRSVWAILHRLEVKAFPQSFPDRVATEKKNIPEVKDVTRRVERITLAESSGVLSKEEKSSTRIHK